MNWTLQLSVVAVALSSGFGENNILDVNKTVSPHEENSPNRLLHTHAFQTTACQEAEEVELVASSVPEADIQKDVESELEEPTVQVPTNEEAEEPKLKVFDAQDVANYSFRSLERKDDTTDYIERDGKILAIYTTKTKALIATSTVLMLSTCFSTTNMPSCTGRRKRNVLRAKFNSLVADENGQLLSSSLGDGLTEPEFNIESEVDAPSGRKFTIWSTLFSTYTVVTTSFYEGTTVTVSALCNPGFAASCFG